MIDRYFFTAKRRKLTKKGRKALRVAMWVAIVLLASMCLFGCSTMLEKICDKSGNEMDLILAMMPDEGQPFETACLNDSGTALEILVTVGLPLEKIHEIASNPKDYPLANTSEKEAKKVMDQLEEVRVPLCQLYNELLKQPGSDVRCVKMLKANQESKLCKESK